jgi:hypothetical protein
MPQYSTTDRFKMAECILVSISLCNLCNVRRSINVNRYSSNYQRVKEEIT